MGGRTGVISLDTNVILRFLLDDVPNQTKAATLLITSKPVYATDVVIIEVIYVLQTIMQLPRQDVTQLVGDFLGFPQVVHNTVYLLDAIERYKLHPALSIVDCYAAAESAVYGNRLATFDKRLATQGGQHVFKP